MTGIRTSRASAGKLSLKQMSVHFAAITLVATGLLAVFADGERSKAALAAAAAHEADAEDAIGKAAKGAAKNLITIRPRRDTAGQFSPDPVRRPIPSGEMSYARAHEVRHEPGYEPGPDLLPTSPLAQTASPANLPAGMTLEEWLALNEEERGDLPAIRLGPDDLRAIGALPSSGQPAG
ncbi:hypothetical protein [Novosphingobium sp. BW1]|uniref:hypothetical protein n=1 Tax=Novosphingobium sp. BW1 TaxID=2592621 RepID=UPI0011DE5A9F|nr:hypothetical protein [Novosphingobium sp. BW1]TYC90710.1 hypothetical protein FMM79_05375 [Novosphingobium sp. BW1]